MEKLSLQELQSLRKAQEELNFSRGVYVEFYRKMAKHVYTTELNNLIRGDFSRVDVELNIPQLPPPNSEQQETYYPFLQLDKVMEIYDAVASSPRK